MPNVDNFWDSLFEAYSEPIIGLLSNLGFYTQEPDFFSKEYWQRIPDALVRGQFSAEAGWILAVFFGFVIVFIIIGQIVAKIYRNRKTLGTAPTYAVDDPSKIIHLLNLAVNQRSKFRVNFQREVPGAKYTDAVCIKLAGNEAILEFSSFIQASHSWENKFIDCDFRVREDNQMLFYSFSAKINYVDASHEHTRLVTISIPAHLEIRQRRAHLRITPSSKDIPYLAIWSEDSIKNIKGRPDNPMTWGAPGLVQTYAELSETEGFTLYVANISAGGMNLHININAARRLKKEYDQGQRFLIELHLMTEDLREETFYLLARVQNVNTISSTVGTNAPPSHVELGLQFIGAAAFKDQEKLLLNWVMLSGGGSPEIDEWAYSRHLENYRQWGDTI